MLLKHLPDNILPLTKLKREDPFQLQAIIVIMAYIPPHKRHSKDSERPSPVPELLIVPRKRHLNLKSPSKQHNYEKSGDVVYGENAIFKWLIVGNLDADDHNHLEPISVEAFEQRMREKPLVLVNNHPPPKENEGESTISNTRSESVAVNVWPDLLSSFEIVRNKMESKEFGKGKPAMVARFGKILFHGSPSVSSESVLGKDHVAETTLRRMKRTFYTNTPCSYMENIISGVVPNIGVDLVEEKNIYHIKLSDKTQPGSALKCKCGIKEDKKLELHKAKNEDFANVQLKPIRQMVVDVSCIDKNLDLRLALYTKRTISALTDEEMHSIRNIVDSAILDPEVKGGLRWPFGKACSTSDRYAVIGVWHTIAKKYKSPSLSLMARHVDRFDFKVAISEATFEVALKLRRMVSDLQVNCVCCFHGDLCLLLSWRCKQYVINFSFKFQEEKVETDSIFDMFKDNLRMIWDHFLCYDQYFP
ncbi:hypothetical protein EZV62_007493 [Acer yangbiense]|uniref:DUF7903 domain-containing protein n=1 Tax=Acer yangbiense TaxID=1000413 RepID=A0A5C7IAQ1_9ROSI|nr:hypothetical protein EZV62_007493 [Acer yangbiense]